MGRRAVELWVSSRHLRQPEQDLGVGLHVPPTIIHRLFCIIRSDLNKEIGKQESRETTVKPIQPLRGEVMETVQKKQFDDCFKLFLLDCFHHLTP